VNKCKLAIQTTKALYQTTAKFGRFSLETSEKSKLRSKKNLFKYRQHRTKTGSKTDLQFISTALSPMGTNNYFAQTKQKNTNCIQSKITFYRRCICFGEKYTAKLSIKCEILPKLPKRLLTSNSTLLFL